jgi:hypothetical protein
MSSSSEREGVWMRAPSVVPVPAGHSLLFLSLMPLLSSAENLPGSPPMGYAPATAPRPGVATSANPRLLSKVLGTPTPREGLGTVLSSGAKPPSLYETLRRDPGLGHAPSGHIEDPRQLPQGPIQGAIASGVTGPPSRGANPGSASDYRYRPLTTQERDRGQVTSGWRPVTLPRQESPAPLNPAPPLLPGRSADRGLDSRPASLPRTTG